MTRQLPALAGPIPMLPSFFRDDVLDLVTLARQAERMRAAGCEAVVLGGAEGEGPTLTRQEMARSIVALAARGDIAIGVAICASGTDAAADDAHRAEEAGAGFLVVSPPPYNKPTLEGVARHLECIAAATRLPIVLRDDPGRTKIALSDAVIGRLCRSGLIAAFAPAPGDMRRAPLIDEASEGAVRTICGSDFDAVLGQCDDDVPWLSLAAVIDPDRCRALHLARVRQDLRAAARLSRELFGLLRALDMAEPAVAVKRALSRLGMADLSLRLPLVPAGGDVDASIDAALASLGLIEPVSPTATAAC